MSGPKGINAWEKFWQPTREHYERALEDQELQEAEIQAERENEMQALEELEADDSGYPPENDGRCSYCGGQGWGIIGVDWDCEDAINGPYDGETETCPNCGGSGRAEDMAFW